MINLYYKNILLGTLSFENDMFNYVSNLTGEMQLNKLKNRFINYNLYNSKPAQSSKIFKEFQMFIDATSRSDIKLSANILATDSEYQKLSKLANLKMFGYDFSIENI